MKKTKHLVEGSVKKGGVNKAPIGRRPPPPKPQNDLSKGLFDDLLVSVQSEAVDFDHEVRIAKRYGPKATFEFLNIDEDDGDDDWRPVFVHLIGKQNGLNMMVLSDNNEKTVMEATGRNLFRFFYV